MTCHSGRRAASSGSTTRTAAAATAKAPSSTPMVEADMPRSWPRIGSTKVCTSQAQACSQLTNSSSRSCGIDTRSHTERGPSPAAGTVTGSAGARCTSHQPISGNKASAAKAARKPVRCAGAGPAWSISSPVIKGPRKLASAGAIAIQLNTVFSSVVSAAARPTWRCTAICTVPAEAPASSAVMHSTGNTGHSAASAAPSTAADTPRFTGRCKPCRSASRPAGKASSTGDSANSASSTPTAAGL